MRGCVTLSFFHRNFYSSLPRRWLFSTLLRTHTHTHFALSFSELHNTSRAAGFATGIQVGRCNWKRVQNVTCCGMINHVLYSQQFDSCLIQQINTQSPVLEFQAFSKIQSDVFRCELLHCHLKRQSGWWKLKELFFFSFWNINNLARACLSDTHMEL